MTGSLSLAILCRSGGTLVVTGQPLSGYPVSEWGDTSSDRSASLWLSCVGVGGTLVVTGQPLSGYPVSEWGDTSSDRQPLSGYPVSEWGDTSSDRSASLWLSCVGVGGH